MVKRQGGRRRQKSTRGGRSSSRELRFKILHELRCGAGYISLYCFSESYGKFGKNQTWKVRVMKNQIQIWKKVICVPTEKPYAYRFSKFFFEESVIDVELSLSVSDNQSRFSK